MKFNQLSFAPFPAIKDGPMIREVTDQITDYVVKQMRRHKMVRLYIVAAENVSFTKQLIEPRLLLPITKVFKQPSALKPSGEETYLESALDSVTEYMTRMWLGSTLYQILLSAKAAEFGALATQMEGNLTSVKKVQKKLNIMYKKARNDKVDASMREIFVSTMVAAG